MLRVSNLHREVNDRVILTNISFTVNKGDILFIRGPSGVGKSLLLRSLAYLDPAQGGTLRLEGKSPEETGIPLWRCRVTYVPQSRVHPRGTPSELYYTAQQFTAQRRRPRGDLPALIHALGLEQLVLNQPWAELSGGQAQRVALAICLALKPDFLLLDEPTSALDQDSAKKAERVLKESGAGIIWVTHDDSQPGRVGGRVLSLPLGTEASIFEAATAGTDGPTIWGLLAALLLVLVVVLLSAYLRLSLHRTTVVAALRGVAQLIVLAYILTPAFALDRWWLTLVYFIVLLLVSSAEVVSRPSVAYEGMLANVALSMGISLSLVMLFAIFLVFRPRPWYNVHILLPAIAMLLGNAVSGASLGLSTALEELTSERDRVEGLLAIGASRREAMKGTLQRSLQAALVPTLNQMGMVGIVSLPEFLSGQLINGAAPLQAVRYQLVVMLLSLVCSALTSAAAVSAALFSAMDGQHRLRTDRLLIRPKSRESGVATWLQSQAVKGWGALRKKLHKVGARLSVALGSRSHRSGRAHDRNWLLQSPLAQRVLGRKFDEDGDGADGLDSRLRGVRSPGSDDERESMFSGILSDTEEQQPFASADISSPQGAAGEGSHAFP